LKERILHIVYSGFGGTTDYVFNLVRGDREQRYEHAIIFFGIEETEEATLEFARSICNHVAVILKQKGRDKHALDQLGNEVREVKPMAVILHINSLIFDLNKWFPDQVRLIFVEHQAHHLKTKKEWVYSVLAQRRAGYVVSLTGEALRTLKQKIRFLFKASKNVVITTGIFAADYRHHTRSGRIKIGMVGRVNKFRDHETLIRSFLELNRPDTELHIAGDGPLLEELSQKYESEDIFFHGLLNREEVSRFLAELDVYVQASFGETSSIALMQAQASHLPVIASAVPGITNVLDSTNAVLVAPGNAAVLKNAMKLLIENPSLAQSKSEAGYTRLTSYSSFEMFAAYKKLLL
jgi:L-malate glycosyltransferase